MRKKAPFLTCFSNEKSACSIGGGAGAFLGIYHFYGGLPDDELFCYIFEPQQEYALLVDGELSVAAGADHPALHIINICHSTTIVGVYLYLISALSVSCIRSLFELKSTL